MTTAQLPAPAPHPDDWFIGPWGIKTRDGRIVATPEEMARMGGRPNPATKKDRRLKENRPKPSKKK